MRDLMSSWEEKENHNFWKTEECVFNQGRGFTYHFDEFEEFNDGWVEEVVSSAVVQQGINDWFEQVPFDDVAVVVLVLQSNDPAHETQRT